MNIVGSYEAKTHLPQLIDRVLQGETVQITRHGVPVANLVPVDKRLTSIDIIHKLRQFRKGKTLEGMSTRALISAGRE